MPEPSRSGADETEAKTAAATTSADPSPIGPAGWTHPEPEPEPEPKPPELIPPEPIPPPGATKQSTEPTVRAAVVRVIALFAALGMGLGGGTLIFLAATGFFGRRGFQDVANLSLGSFVVSAVLVFALLIGIVIAGFGGAYVAAASRLRARAAAAGAIAGGVGHIALVVTAGVILLVGISVRSPGGTVSASPAPASTSASPAAPGPFGDAPCEETFGEDSPLCTTARSVAPSLPVPAQAIQPDADVVTAANLAKVGLGVVPAALVGALSAAILFVRRRPG